MFGNEEWMNLSISFFKYIVGNRRDGATPKVTVNISILPDLLWQKPIFARESCPHPPQHETSIGTTVSFTHNRYFQR